MYNKLTGVVNITFRRRQYRIAEYATVRNPKYSGHRSIGTAVGSAVGRILFKFRARKRHDNVAFRFAHLLRVRKCLLRLRTFSLT